MKKTTPYFLWDYDLTEDKVRKILKKGDESSRRWLVARILSHASFEDVFKYLTLKEILAIFARLRMKKEIKKYWERAFSAWGCHAVSQK